MKHFPLILAALALSCPLLQAKVYDITLNDATTYHQCHIKFQGSNTKFVGIDKNGKEQTVTVPSSRILNIREVEEEQADDPEPAPAPTPAPKAEDNKPEQPQEADKPAADEGAAPAEEAKADKPAEPQPGEAKAAEVDKGDAASQDEAAPEEDGQAQNASLRLREKLKNAEAAYAELRAPSKSLQSNARAAKQAIVRSLDKLDRQALAVAELQNEFNQAGSGEFAFEIVSDEQRTQYERDGKAAYEAMVIDMKEKPGARKVGGIDKYEIMRERYQGIPEYKEAHKWYGTTLQALNRKWTKMLANEEQRRKNAPAAKKSAMAEDDRKQMEQLRAHFEKEGEDIAAVWYNPLKRNLAMLTSANNKAKEALRRHEMSKLDPAVGPVPDLLHDFWKNMDEARRLMVQGDLEQAEEALKKDESLRKLTRLNRNIFPNEYRTPLTQQHQALEKEIRERQRKTDNVKRKLEREASALERAAHSAEAQIDALLEDIQREKDLDSGENTVVMETSIEEPDTTTLAEETTTAP